MAEKKAFITGGTSGIGAGYSQAFAKKGYDLIIVDKDISPEKNFFIDSIEKKYNIKVNFLKADLSKEAHIKQLEARIAKHNDIYVLINCAGFGLGKGFEEADEKVEDMMIKVHSVAPMHLMRAVLPQMRKRNEGAIINISSLSGLIPMRNSSVYGATKAFLRIISESLSMELRETKIKVQVLAPGFVKTHFHDKLKGTKSDMQKAKFIKWNSVDQVIALSLRCLRRNKVLCIPGRRYRFLYWLSRVLPAKMVYRIMGKKRR